MSEVYRVCKPGDTEFQLTFCGFDIKRVFGIPGVDGITYLILDISH
jgi:hypothetical protein